MMYVVHFFHTVFPVLLCLMLLTGCAGQVSIKSNPSGAEIYDANNIIGETPKKMILTFNAKQDSKVLVIKKAGFYDELIKVSKPMPGKISFDQKFTVVLEKKSKTFTITSQPTGATVLLNGNKAGMTPLSYTLTFQDPLERYTAVLSKERYYDKSIPISLRPHEKSAYHIDLQKIEFIPFDLKQIEPGPEGFRIRREDTLSYEDIIERSPNVSAVTRVTDNRNKKLQIGPPVLSPVEDLLIYDVLTDESGSQNSNLYRQRIGTTGKSPVTQGSRIAMSAAFSTDGKYILFSSNRISNTLNLWRVQSDGRGGITSITSSLSQDSFPATTKDLIYYTSILPEATTYQIWSITADGRLPTQLREGYSPNISPDGNKILFVRKEPLHDAEQIWLMDRDGRNETQLTQNQLYNVRSPKWSPDGKRIVYASNEGIDSSGNRNYDIWIMNGNGGNKTQLTTNGSHDDAPCWDHKGQHVYFRSNRGFKWNIWRLRPHI